MPIRIPDKVLSALEQWGTSVERAERLIQYLKFFGYIAKDGEITIDELKEAVVRLQADAGILVDGEAGPKTIAVLDWPRCGMPETMENASNSSKWGIKNISYFIEARDADMPAAQWDDLIKQSFEQWENVCNLTFTQVSSASKANIVIGIGTGSRDNFDGPSGTLAWAYLPPSSNFKGQVKMKFDTGETWINQSGSRGIRLKNVATHEIGHTLGLGHSKVSSALMAPFYAFNIVGPQQNDDIPRAQNLYGKPVVVTPPVEPPVEPEPPVTPPSVPTTDTIIRIKGKVENISIDGYRVQKMS